MVGVARRRRRRSRCAAWGLPGEQAAQLPLTCRPGTSKDEGALVMVRAGEGACGGARGQQGRAVSEPCGLCVLRRGRRGTLADPHHMPPQNTFSTALSRTPQADMAILDEIDSGLDIDALRDVAKAVNQLRSDDTGVLMVTHYKVGGACACVCI